MEFHDDPPQEDPLELEAQPASIKQERLMMEDDPLLGVEETSEQGGGGTRCMVCLGSSATRVVQSWMQFYKHGEPLSVSRSVSTMFLLRKLLQYGRDAVAGLLVRGHGVNPGNWCRLCQSCSEHVRKAYQIHQDCLKLQRQIEDIGQGLRAKLEESLLHSSGGGVDIRNGVEQEEEEEAEGAFLINLHSMVREVYYSASNNIMSKNAEMKTEPPGSRPPPHQNQSNNNTFTDDSNNYTDSDNNASNEETFEPEEEDEHGNNNSNNSDDSEQEDEEYILPTRTRSSIIQGKSSRQKRQKAVTSTSTTTTTASSKKCRQKRTKGTYQCSQCVQVCQTLEAFQKHQELHSLHPDFPCPVCSYPLSCQSVRVRHMELKHPGTELSCSACPSFKTLSASTYYTHDNEHRMRAAMELLLDDDGANKSDKLLLYVCKYCGTQGSLEELTRHMRLKHLPQLGIESFPCGLCEMVFYRQVEVDRHWKAIHGKTRPRKVRGGGGNGGEDVVKKELESHIITANHNNPPRKTTTSVSSKNNPKKHCRICNAGLDSKEELLAHLRSAHPDVYRFKCDQCGLAYKNRNNLTEHLVGAHSAQANCPYCNKTVRSKLHLRHHYPHCPRFPSSNNSKNNSLRRRRSSKGVTTPGNSRQPAPPPPEEEIINIKSKKGKYKCSLCPQEYQIHHYFVAHLKAHSSHTEWVCPICNFPSPNQQSRLIHMEKKHPKAPLSCDQCDFVTTNSAHFYSHQREHKLRDALEPVAAGGGGTESEINNLILRCKFCGESGEWAAMSLHMESKHLTQLGIQHYSCPTCDKVFYKKFEFQNHVRLEEEEKEKQGDGGDRNRKKSNKKQHRLAGEQQQHMMAANSATASTSHHSKVNCPYCNRTLKRKIYLRDHYRRSCRKYPANLKKRKNNGVATVPRAFKSCEQQRLQLKCGKCPQFRTYRQPELQLHLKEHAFQDNFQNVDGGGDGDDEWVLCKLCNLNVRTSTRFSHLKMLHPAVIAEQLVWCHLCNHTSTSKTSLQNHIAKMHAEEGEDRRSSEICEHCGTSFASKHFLTRHLERFHSDQLADPGSAKHAPRPKVPCRLCGALLLNVRFLRDHLWGVHQDVYRLKCDLCESRFKKPHLLEIHKRSKHLKETKTCPYCLKRICHASTLTTHWRLYCKQVPPTHSESGKTGVGEEEDSRGGSNTEKS